MKIPPNLLSKMQRRIFGFLFLPFGLGVHSWAWLHEQMIGTDTFLLLDVAWEKRIEDDVVTAVTGEVHHLVEDYYSRICVVMLLDS